MSAAAGGPRDGGEIEALVTDHYLDALLRGDQRAPLGTWTPGSGRLAPDVRLAVSRLSRDLTRFHPSFRFEERLALRLDEIATAMRRPSFDGAGGTLVPFDPAVLDDAPLDEAPPLASLFAGPVDERLERVRPLLIGGALTSAALSLAGAAYVAWRRTRPATPMAKAVRAVARGRLA